MSSYSKTDPVALNFNESCLRSSDIELLKGPYWLNDQIISFYFDYLEERPYKNNEDLQFVPPEVAQLLKLMDTAELEELLRQRQMLQKKFIFFALNDNETTAAGGTHWSLLVLSRPERTFFHFDSTDGSNLITSNQFAYRLMDAMNCNDYTVKAMKGLQQVNMYDCGIHVLCMTDKLAAYVTRYDKVAGVTPLELATVNGKRTELLKLIVKLGGHF